MSNFRDELGSLLNRHSQENGSDTPDFILAAHLEGSLRVFDETLQAREKWYGRTPEPTGGDGPDPVEPPSEQGGLPEQPAMVIDVARPTGEPTKAQAEALWQLLDNIDTLDDSCRDNDAAFRRSAIRLAKMRWEFTNSDGYRLFWEDKEPRDFTNPGFSFPVSEAKIEAEGGCGTAAPVDSSGGETATDS